MQNVHGSEPKRCGPLTFFDLGRGLRRVFRQTKRGGQSQEGLVRGIARLAKRVCVARLDADEPGEPHERVAVGHIIRPPDQSQRN